jgi:hypothetical protein
MAHTVEGLGRVLRELVMIQGDRGLSCGADARCGDQQHHL